MSLDFDTVSPSIDAGDHRMGFTPPRVWSHGVWRCLYLRESNHAECIEVYIFNSKSWGKKSKLCPRETGNRCRRSKIGFYTHASLITLSAEEFISSTQHIGTKKSESNQHRILYKKSNWNRIEREKHNSHITTLQHFAPMPFLIPQMSVSLQWQYTTIVTVYTARMIVPVSMVTVL